MKKAISALLLLSLLMPMSSWASERDFQFEGTRQGDIALYSLRSVAENLGYTIEWNPTQRTATLTKGAETLTFNMASSMVVKNGISETTATKPVILEGRIYIDAAMIRTGFGLVTTSDGRFNEEVVSAEGISRSEAVSTAIANDRDLKILKNSQSQSEEVNKNAELNVTNALYQLPYYGSGATEQLLSSAWQGVLGSQIKVELSKKAIENRLTILTMQVENQYDSLVAQQRAIGTYELASAVASEAYRQGLLKYQNGLISSLDNDKLKAASDNGRATLDIAKAKLQESLQTFSSLTGIKVEDIKLAEANQFQPLGEFSADSAFLDAQKNSYALFSLDKSRLVAKYGLDYYVFNAGQTPYRAKEMDLSNAEIEVQKEMERERKVILNSWQQIIQLELSHASLLTDYAQKNKEQQALALQVNLGLATEFQLKSASLAVKQLENQIEQITVQHAALKRLLDKPWLGQ